MRQAGQVEASVGEAAATAAVWQEWKEPGCARSPLLSGSEPRHSASPAPSGLRQDPSLPGPAALLLVSESSHTELSPWDACTPRLSPGTPRSVSGSWCGSHLYQLVLASCASCQSPLQDIFIKPRPSDVLGSLLAYTACPADQDFH